MKYKYKDILIIFDKQVVEIFKSYRQTKKKPEAGGILLAKIYENEIRILKASIPSSFDSAKRYSFIRNKDSAQVIINHEFANSNGTIIYIGEWHTHPEYNPTPSSVDINMIKLQYKKNQLNEDILLMLIIGLKSNYLAVYDGSKILRLKTC